ncbi:MAG TPA: hypothetical protein H9890_01805 [Candidatus Faecalibacterium intestinigallinarum]|uniref:Uncharacterized protein n=1 Tax=Candidatus Faecalibacterium intestinigallinarum TaxID=2838581 RepID=A0A9D1TVW8_9FIRM|nr:hypothetical protein [Candidatus Faecalibacterium intestinigallinarum]
MTGRLHPYLPELSIRDYNIYLRYMRGVKYQVYLDYGIMPYGALAHKGGVMALLADSLAGRQATCQDIRMPGSLSKVPLMCQTRGIRLAAQIEVLMNWHRLQDRRNEELPFRQQMERMSQKVTLQSAYHKAAQEEPALERIFCQQQAQAAAQQQLRGQNYAVASEPMSNVYGALFSLLAPDDPVQRKNMRYIGSCIGKAFYLLDKADRHERDQKEDRYNVFLANGLSREAAKENARRQAIASINDLSRVYTLMDVKLNRSLLDNIMILGLRDEVDPLEHGGWELQWELPS